MMIEFEVIGLKNWHIKESNKIENTPKVQGHA